jgi:hypothetical protein
MPKILSVKKPAAARDDLIFEDVVAALEAGRSLEQSRRGRQPRSLPPDLNLGRRLGHHGQLRSGVPGETTTHRQGAHLLSLHWL